MTSSDDLLSISGSPSQMLENNLQFTNEESKQMGYSDLIDFNYIENKESLRDSVTEEISANTDNYIDNFQDRLKQIMKDSNMDGL